MNEAQPRSNEGSGTEAAPLAGSDWEARELNHRLANSLQLAVDLLGFEQARAADPHTREVLEETMSRLVAVGQLHRYLAARDPGSLVDLRGFLDGLCGFVGLSTGLACHVSGDSVRVRADMAQQIGLLVNECAINARKHAYGVDGGVLRIESAISPGVLRILVADEGRGLVAPATHQGLGMSIIGAIVRQLGGSFTAETRGGARFNFLIPFAGAAPLSDRSFASWNEA